MDLMDFLPHKTFPGLIFTVCKFSIVYIYIYYIYSLSLLAHCYILHVHPHAQYKQNCFIAPLKVQFIDLLCTMIKC